MVKIITTSDLQKQIGQLKTFVMKSWTIVTNNGKPTAVILPYFEENEQAVADYLEDYEMYKNAEKLRGKFRKSVESGISDFSI